MVMDTQNIDNNKRHYKSTLIFQQSWSKIPLSMARFTSAKAPIASGDPAQNVPPED